MTYAVFCGVCWILGGVISIASAITKEKMCRKFGMAIFLISFIVFVGLFGAVMIKVNEENYGYKKLSCSERGSKFMRSGREFMAYSICSFITITAVILIYTVAFSK